MSRGTTLVEAHLRNRSVIGNDINPLSQVLVKPRLAHQTFCKIRERIERITLPDCKIENDDLLAFFATETLKELCSWRRYFEKRKSEGLFDRIDAWIEMVACNRLTGHSKGFFSVYTLPPNQATSIKRQRKINAQRNQHPEYRNTRELILKKSKSLLRDELPVGVSGTSPRLLTESADSTPTIADSSVQLEVTSPPFLNAVNYLNDNWMRNWFCNVEPDSKKLWQLGSLDEWTVKMTNTLCELRRILKADGRIAFEVGEVRKGSVRLEERVVEAGVKVGLQPDYTLINEQRFTKTANC